MAHSGNSAAPSLAPSLASYFKGKEQRIPPPVPNNRSPRGRSGCCCILTWLCTTLITALILVGMAVLVFWLVVQPRLPKFEVQDVRLSVVPINLSTVNINAYFAIMTRNPNKHMGIYYNNIHVNVQTNGVTISNGSIPSIYQGHKNNTYLTGNLSSQGVTLSPDLQVLTKNPTNVPMYAKVDVKARVKVGSVKSPRIKVQVHCDLNVDLTRTTRSQLLNEHCKVKL